MIVLLTEPAAFAPSSTIECSMTEFSAISEFGKRMDALMTAFFPTIAPSISWLWLSILAPSPTEALAPIFTGDSIFAV